jgi:hypothetical protein
LFDPSSVTVEASAASSQRARPGIAIGLNGTTVPVHVAVAVPPPPTVRVTDREPDSLNLMTTDAVPCPEAISAPAPTDHVYVGVGTSVVAANVRFVAV